MWSTNNWVPCPLTIDADVKKRLERRRNQDQRKLKKRFAETHYVNAAFQTRPQDLDQLIALVTRFMETHESYRGRGQTSRVQPDVKEDMANVELDLREQIGYGSFGKVQSALIVRLLDALDESDAYEDAVDLDSLH